LKGIQYNHFQPLIKFFFIQSDRRAVDSPGFPVVLKGNTLNVLVPAQRVHHKTDVKFDGVVAYMQVNTTDKSRPMLGVYQAYSVSSGDLSLPYSVQPQ